MYNWYKYAKVVIQKDADVLEFLEDFLGYKETRSSGSHKTFSKDQPGWNNVTVKLPTDRVSRVLQLIGRGWRQPWFEKYWNNKKHLVKEKNKRGEQAVLDFEQYCRDNIDRKNMHAEDIPEVAQEMEMEMEQEQEQEQEISQEKLNDIFKKVPYLKKQYDVMINQLPHDEVIKIMKPQIMSI